MNGICSRRKENMVHIKRLIRNPQGTNPLGIARHKLKRNIKMTLMPVVCEYEVDLSAQNHLVSGLSHHLVF
jgi:hypothetical protein